MNDTATCESQTAHAGRAPPRGNWQWSQTWRNLLFLHWRVPADRLRALVPRELELDSWDGEAWVSAVAFRLLIRLRGLPAIPLCSNFLELNLRTYVLYRGEPGVFFLSMHANSAAAVATARWLTPLPYRYSPMACAGSGDKWQWQCGGHEAARQRLLCGQFCPHDEQATLAADSRDAWLLERYRAFVADRRRGRLYRMAVAHEPWRVSQVTGNIAAVSTEPSLNIPLKCEADCSHYSSGLDALIWPFERLA